MDTDVRLCRCGEEAADDRDGLCRDCYLAEHGPAWDPSDSVGGDVAGYRANMIDAGRGHLL